MSFVIRDKIETNDEHSVNIEGLDIGFILSDDQPLELSFSDKILTRSIGEKWLQGHMAIGICHFLIDEGVELNL